MAHLGDSKESTLQNIKKAAIAPAPLYFLTGGLTRALRGIVAAAAAAAKGQARTVGTSSGTFGWEPAPFTASSQDTVRTPPAEAAAAAEEENKQQNFAFGDQTSHERVLLQQQHGRR
uniref:Uncharacterized protein n=1 Tax=Steinernema glaseri TaxID=37863 RepID=A0A1I7ZHM6_9BILA